MRWMERMKMMVDKDYGYVDWKEFEGLKHNYKVATNLVMEEI